MDNLTRDAVAARLAGMTYGKYMAQKQSGAAAAEATISPDRIRYCKGCGKPFETGKHRRKYCSGACREKTRSQLDRAKNINPKYIV